MPSKDNNISTATMRREDFTICLVLPREVFKANRGDTMSAIKQAAEGEHSLVPAQPDPPPVH